MQPGSIFQIGLVAQLYTPLLQSQCFQPTAEQINQNPYIVSQGPVIPDTLKTPITDRSVSQNPAPGSVFITYQDCPELFEMLPIMSQAVLNLDRQYNHPFSTTYFSYPERCYMQQIANAAAQKASPASFNLTGMLTLAEKFKGLLAQRNAGMVIPEQATPFFSCLFQQPAENFQNLMFNCIRLHQLSVKAPTSQESSLPAVPTSPPKTESTPLEADTLLTTGNLESKPATPIASELTRVPTPTISMAPVSEGLPDKIFEEGDEPAPLIREDSLESLDELDPGLPLCPVNNAGLICIAQWLIANLFNQDHLWVNHFYNIELDGFAGEQAILKAMVSGNFDYELSTHRTLDLLYLSFHIANHLKTYDYDNPKDLKPSFPELPDHMSHLKGLYDQICTEVEELALHPEKLEV